MGSGSGGRFFIGAKWAALFQLFGVAPFVMISAVFYFRFGVMPSFQSVLAGGALLVLAVVVAGQAIVDALRILLRDQLARPVRQGAASLLFFSILAGALAILWYGTVLAPTWDEADRIRYLTPPEVERVTWGSLALFVLAAALGMLAAATREGTTDA